MTDDAGMTQVGMVKKLIEEVHVIQFGQVEMLTERESNQAKLIFECHDVRGMEWRDDR